MIHIRLNNRSILSKIKDFYIDIWHDRLVNLSLRKYNYRTALRNYFNVITFFGETFNDDVIRNPIINDWKAKNWKEIQYNNWHFAVIVQLDLFGDNIAIVQDCCYDKDYHNDNMETQPFVMDNPDDKSHLVDWRKHTNGMDKDKISYDTRLLEHFVRKVIKEVKRRIINEKHYK